MEDFVMKLIEMSISASWLVLVVLLLRLLLKNAPRWIHVALWALVAVRLVCPVSLETAVSLTPTDLTEQVMEALPNSYYGDSMIYGYGSENYDLAVSAGIQPEEGDNGYRYVLTQPDDPTKPVHTMQMLWDEIWLLGMTAMVIYALVSFVRLKRKVSASIHLDNGVYLCDYIDTPFILGIIRPRIYLPSAMEPDSASHVLAHERAHIARRDHWWKPLGYLLLTVHWFNPLMWLAYILLCRDIELACDEKVVKQMALPERKSYSDALLQCSVRRMHVAACPLAFGEVGVKERVKTVLNYKKPAFWIVLVAVIALIVTAVCFLTDPVGEENLKAGTYRVEEVVYRNPAISYYMTEEAAPQFEITAGNTLRIKESGEYWTDLGEFSEIRLSDLDYEDLFSEDDLNQIREENQKAWILSIPPEEGIITPQFYMLLLQENGEFYLADGVQFPYMDPAQEDAQDMIYMLSWFYRLRVTDPDQPETESNQESPYNWTKNLRTDDVFFCAASLHNEDWAADPVEGAKLAELVGLLNQVQEDQFVTKTPAGENDPLWNHHGVHLWMSSGRDAHMLLRYVEDTLILSSTNNTGRPNGGYWTIENQELKDWMLKLSYGDTYMLSEANREEIRQLLRMDYVEFFAPQEYEDYLFLGCKWDHDRGLGAAVFEKVAYGYKLRKLIRDEEVKQCASGSALYYCDYNNHRIFLVMNDSVNGMEFDGAYEATHTIDTHPGLVVEYFPRNLGSMYRFIYSGGSTTMYMDWDNQTHGKVPNDAAETFANPDDAYSVCSQLRPEQIEFVAVTELVEVDERLNQGYSYYPNSDELLELLNLLQAIPEDAYEQAQYPEKDFRTLDIQFRNYAGVAQASPCLTLRLHEGAVYYQFRYEWMKPYQTWKINSTELVQYLESFFGGDVSGWERFAPCPKIDGIIDCAFDGVEIITYKMGAFEYHVSEEGIRFKPEGQEGYVLMYYSPESLAGCGTGLELKKWESDQQHSCATGYYDGSEYWSFRDLTVTSGDTDIHVHFINENSAAWVEEFSEEISWMIMFLDFQVTD